MITTLVLTWEGRGGPFTALAHLEADPTVARAAGAIIKDAWNKRLTDGNQPGILDEDIREEFLRTAQAALGIMCIEYGRFTLDDTVIVKL